jgi:hypothetical protein
MFCPPIVLLLKQATVQWRFAPHNFGNLRSILNKNWTYCKVCSKPKGKTATCHSKTI